jgi:hypothetical protein
MDENDLLFEEECEIWALIGVLLARLSRNVHRHHRRRLSKIEIGFLVSFEGGENEMPAKPGPIMLTTLGQVATAVLFYFDQNGQPMPAGFVPPEATFSTDDTAGAIAKVVDNGNDTATVTAEGNGVANLSVKLTSAEGVEIDASVAVTVSLPTPPPPPPPPTPVLTSVQIGFE